MNNRQPSSMPCPRCRRLISRNSPDCIHCGLKRPLLYRQVPILNALLQDKIQFSDQIVLACFILFALSFAIDLGGVNFSGGLFNLISPSSQALYKLGMGGVVPVLYEGRWWTLITANYLHGGIIHIAFNMLWLRQLGPVVEELFGHSRFWIIYTLAGLGGSLVSVLAGTGFFVGASGAIFGLFGALIFYGRHRGGTFGSGIFRQMLIWAGIGFLFGLAVPGVDNFGHLGGLLAGLGSAALVGYQERRRQGLGHHLVALALLIGVGVCFAFMLVFFFIG